MTSNTSIPLDYPVLIDIEAKVHASFEAKLAEAERDGSGVVTMSSPSEAAAATGSDAPGDLALRFVTALIANRIIDHLETHTDWARIVGTDNDDRLIFMMVKKSTLASLTSPDV